MYEKVNPAHPDKIADRIAGGIVDLAYAIQKRPKVAVEVLIGHGHCTVIIESSVDFQDWQIQSVVDRIAGKGFKLEVISVRQDKDLADNQEDKIRCGDNGIFKGCPVTPEQKLLTRASKLVYEAYKSDGKLLIDDDEVTICQSYALNDEISRLTKPLIKERKLSVNPLGYWTGGLDVDSGATNRKLGSDMGDAVTGGGLHGKDLSKADVTLNICSHILAEKYHKPIEMSCSIGDESVYIKQLGVELKYSNMVDAAKDYIERIGGFEKLAEWGLIR